MFTPGVATRSIEKLGKKQEKTPFLIIYHDEKR